MKSTEFLTEDMSEQLQQFVRENHIDPEYFKTIEDIVEIGKECKLYLSQVEDPLSLFSYKV